MEALLLNDQQVQDVEALMREAAATLILPRFRQLATHEIDTKSHPGDLVTVADREAEDWLTPKLKELLPGSRVVGEEAASAHPHILDDLEGEAPVWLIDPVDGTANFVKGEPRFGVMVALVDGGVSRAGFIYAPVEDVMAVARRGEGATLDGAPLRGRERVPFPEAHGDYSSKYVKPPLRDHLLAAVEGCAGTRAGHCSAYAYLDTARGQLDFVLQYLMSPWDHAAGSLLVEEAGGGLRVLDNGEPYTPVKRKPRAALAVGDDNQWAVYRAALK